METPTFTPPPPCVASTALRSAPQSRLHLVQAPSSSSFESESLRGAGSSGEEVNASVELPKSPLMGTRTPERADVVQRNMKELTDLMGGFSMVKLTLKHV